MDKLIMTDGAKSVNLLDSDDPSVWSFYSNAPRSTQDMLYGRVSAAFRAYNLKANTVGNMPFTLNKLSNGEEYDESNTWENKVGFLPNPSELFRLDTLSYMSTNTIYNMRTTDALGYKQKGLYHAVAYNFRPFVNAGTGQLEYIERYVGTGYERYTPDDKRLVRMWRLDHTTEVLPSPNTEAQAIMNAAGEVYYADLWIKHFYERGGVPPTVIAMKGAVNPDKKSTEENSWKDWILGLGARFRWNPTRVVNADALEVKQFGSSVTDLKNNETYQRAIANIAMGTGMPLSLLLANSANRATAQIEKATWYENDIIPFCNWLAYGYNEQVFMPLGLFLEFHPETLDPEQEDETQRASAINTFMDFLAKCPTFEIFIGTCDTFGYELSDSLVEAAEKYYMDKKANAVIVAEQTKPKEEPIDVVAENIPPELPAPKEDVAPAKWLPSLDQLRELQRWQELAFRKFKRDEPLTFEWRNDTLPEAVYEQIRTNLPNAKEESAIKQVFEAAQDVPQPEPVDHLKALAESINKMADALMATKQLTAST